MRYFAVHNMIIYAIYAHRLKRASPYVQGNERALYSPLFESLQYTFIKMQTGCWCGNGARLLRIDRLVALTIC